MSPNLSDERRQWATLAWQSAVQRGEATDATVDAYLERILQPVLDQAANDITASWKPPEDPEVIRRKEEAAARILTVPAEKLEDVEAAIEAATTET